MSEIVLIDGYQSPTGFYLVQQDDMIHVLSPCCRVKVASYQSTALCTGCEVELNDRCTWSEKAYIEHINNDTDANWAMWGFYWFGFKDFKLRVTL